MRPAKPAATSKSNRVITLVRSPRIVAPSSTWGVDCVTRSPPISAPERTTTSPLSTTTSSWTVPEISASPFRTTRVSRTVPSTRAGPSRMTAASTVSSAAMRSSPVSTIWSRSAEAPSSWAAAGPAPRATRTMAAPTTDGSELSSPPVRLRTTASCRVPLMATTLPAPVRTDRGKNPTGLDERFPLPSQPNDRRRRRTGYAGRSTRSGGGALTGRGNRGRRARGSPLWAKAPLALVRYPGLLAAVVVGALLLSLVAAAFPLFLSRIGG